MPAFALFLVFAPLAIAPLHAQPSADLGPLVPGSVTPSQTGFSQNPGRGRGAVAINFASNREEAVAVWQRHRAAIIATVAALLLQSGLIVALLLERRSRHRSKIALRESEERAEIAGVSLGVGFWTWEPESDHVWTTRQCESLLGSEIDKPLTLGAFLEALRPRICESVHDDFERAVRNGTPFDGEWPVVHGSGPVHWIAAATRPIADSLGRRHVTGVLMDVTARKTAERTAAEQRQELSHLSRVAMLGEMSGAIAHELRQPLMAIRGYAQGSRRLIEKQPPDLDKVRHGLDAIVRAEQHAGRVLDQARALLKRSDALPRPLDLNDAIREILELASVELRARSVTCATRLSVDLPEAIGDRVQLQQVLMNVVLNACDAMSGISPASRRLEVMTVYDERRIQILVRDSGTGIPADYLDRLFEPFVTTKPDGLGLGLAICRSIMRDHGGEIRASNNTGSGSTFRISLPRADRDATPGVDVRDGIAADRGR